MISRAAYPVYEIAKWPNRLQPEPGIYEIVALNKAGKPIAIRRAGGIDKRGVLYIGRSQTLYDRVNKFRRGLFEGTKGHIAGRRYNKRRAIQAVAPNA